MRYLLLYLLFVFSVISVHAQQSFSVYFDSNQYKLSIGEGINLNNWLSTNRDSKIVAVNGYTDEDGTNGFNDTLAQKRVDFVVGLIKDKIKIREDFKTRSFGEQHKLSKIKAENRKVTIYYIEAADLKREDEILGIKKPAQVKKTASRKKYPTQIVLHNPNGTDSEFKLDTVFMQKVNLARPGEKLKVDNLNFQINTFAIVPESRSKLYELLLVMQSNPELKIEIQGHLCCMPTDKQDLSTQRARAVYGFLMANEISKSRMSYKGFGSTQAIYPLPEKSEAERAANRRVEIQIVENP